MEKTKIKHIGYIVAFLLLFFVLAAVCTYFFVETKNDITAQNHRYLKEMSLQNAAAIKKVVNLNIDKVSALAKVIGNEEDSSLKNTMNILSIEANRSSYKRMGYAGLDGQAITTDNQHFNISNRNYFKTALTGDSCMSDKLSGVTDQKNINVYSAPIYRNSKVVGVIFATNTTEIFSDIIDTPLFSSKGYVDVVKQDGSAVAIGKHAPHFNNLFADATIDDDATAIMKKNMSEDKSGIVEYSKDGEEKYAAYCPIGINDWYVISIVPKSVVSKNANNIVYRNLALSLVASIVFFLLAFSLFLQQRNISKKLERIAYFDELIEYPNYTAFVNNATKLLENNPDKCYMFTMVDVDNFKLLNEQLGFETGNRVLKNMAKAFDENIKTSGGLFARIPIDKFILMTACNKDGTPITIRKDFEKIFFQLMGDDFDYYIRFMSGRYITDKGEFSVPEIFEKVNYAHRQAKRLSETSGIIDFFYDDSEKEKALRKNDIENHMHTALNKKEFKMFLQPKYLLKTESIVGAEALVRWQHSDGTITPPGDFIPVFEQNGFVITLDNYMFEEVCKFIKERLDSHKSIVPISVNFSRLHLSDPTFIDRLIAITDNYNVPRKYIEIELTESVIFENENRMICVLEQAHAAGFLLSMDDFGSGYSSLGLLKNLPVDIIKIDRSFFTDNKYIDRAKSVVQIIISMAHKLNAQSVAEGVEDAELVNSLKELGCDIVQGYYFAKPMPTEEFKALLDQ